VQRRCGIQETPRDQVVLIPGLQRTTTLRFVLRCARDDSQAGDNSDYTSS
jgi:hypothetical protein